MSKHILWACLLFGCAQANETILPEQKEVTEAVFASGQVLYSDEYLVAANAEGFLKQVYAKEGDTVKAGTPLLVLSNEVQSFQAATALVNYEEALRNAGNTSPKIQQLEAQIAQLQHTLALDEKNYSRYAALLKSNAVSQLEYDKAKVQYESSQLQLDILNKSLSDLKSNLQASLKNAKSQLDIQRQYMGDYTIMAAASGLILDVMKQAGELVKRGEGIAKMGAGQLITKLYIAEEDINSIRLGQTVHLNLNTDKGRTFMAKVSKIYPAFNEKEQSFVIEVQFAEATPVLRHGTQVQANIIVAVKPHALLIPRKYLLKGNKVLVNGAERPVTVGMITKDWVEVSQGLDAGTAISLPQK
jgi:multidrug efflux pump subunit AcrA (membrane-fusion protein)